MKEMISMIAISKIHTITYFDKQNSVFSHGIYILDVFEWWQNLKIKYIFMTTLLKFDKVTFLSHVDWNNINTSNKSIFKINFDHLFEFLVKSF